MNKAVNCLMLRTADKRLFFTDKNNLPLLMEFSKTCGVEISEVKACGVEVLTLPGLARSICSQNKQTQEPQYEIVRIKEAQPKRSRKNLLMQANLIYNYVKGNFLKERPVSLSDLENKFESLGLSKAALCKHMTRVKSELIKDGYRITKLKRGQYQASKTSLRTK